MSNFLYVDDIHFLYGRGCYRCFGVDGDEFDDVISISKSTMEIGVYQRDSDGSLKVSSDDIETKTFKTNCLHVYRDGVLVPELSWGEQ